ncbi:MAG: DUF4249 family protein [Balneolaceae bacterium]
MKEFGFPLLLLSVLLVACDPSSNRDYQRYIVVESYLIAEQPLQPVLLSWSSPVEQEYRFQDSALPDADVRVQLIGSDGEPDETFPYQMVQPGVYQPADLPTHRVQPRERYRLLATIPGEGKITAVTAIPDTFQVVSNVPESVVYQQDTLRIQISNSITTERQNVYLFQTTASDIRLKNMTPFYRDLVEGGDSTVEEFTNNASTPINEQNFQVTKEGTIELQFPWIAAAFYGPNQIIANSLDRNLVDFLRSQEVQTGGSTLPPGEIPNVISHIDGGVGVFGSLSADTISTRFEKPEIP